MVKERGLSLDTYKVYVHIYNWSDDCRNLTWCMDNGRRCNCTGNCRRMNRGLTGSDIDCPPRRERTGRAFPRIPCNCSSWRPHALWSRSTRSHPHRNRRIRRIPWRTGIHLCTNVLYLQVRKSIQKALLKRLLFNERITGELMNYSEWNDSDYLSPNIHRRRCNDEWHPHRTKQCPTFHIAHGSHKIRRVSPPLQLINRK